MVLKKCDGQTDGYMVFGKTVCPPPLCGGGTTMIIFYTVCTFLFGYNTLGSIFDHLDHFSLYSIHFCLFVSLC